MNKVMMKPVYRFMVNEAVDSTVKIAEDNFQFPNSRKKKDFEIE